MERATGIEPASSAWEADILPMNYARVLNFYIISEPFYYVQRYFEQIEILFYLLHVVSTYKYVPLTKLFTAFH